MAIRKCHCNTDNHPTTHIFTGPHLRALDDSEVVSIRCEAFVDVNDGIGPETTSFRLQFLVSISSRPFDGIKLTDDSVGTLRLRPRGQ